MTKIRKREYELIKFSMVGFNEMFAEKLANTLMPKIAEILLKSINIRLAKVNYTDQFGGRC